MRIHLIRRLRRVLEGGTSKTLSGIFRRQTESFHSAYSVVCFFYASQFLYLSEAYDKWIKWRNAHSLNPVWPMFWAESFGIVRTVDLVIILYTLGVISAALFARKRVCRVLLFAGLFLLAAFDNSFGKISHGWHAWIYTSFLFIFLPDGSRDQMQSRLARQKYLSVFLAAQAMILLLYSLAGFWKISAAIEQTIKGEMSAFSINGFAYIIANRLLQNESQSLLGPAIISSPWIGWAIFIIGIYFELFALLALRRFSLHRFWGFGLIGMHLGSTLTLTMRFSKNILLLGMLFVCSPFYSSQRANVRRFCADLPVFGIIARRLIKTDKERTSGT